MLWAMLNDIAQRLITLNKIEQRRHLTDRLKSLNLTDGTKVLDFGCGTGLFARTFFKNNFRYLGYDIDEKLIDYASRLYKKCKFSTSSEYIKRESPFDLVVANCCFHHIDDLQLHIELERIREIIADNGIFMMIDMVRIEKPANPLHGLLMKLEQGKYLRSIAGYRNLIEQHFNIVKIDTQHSHPFSIKNNLLYYDFVIFECKK